MEVCGTDRDAWERDWMFGIKYACPILQSFVGLRKEGTIENILELSS